MDKPSGAAVYAGFRERVDAPGARPDRRISMLDLILATGGNLAAFAACFSPWMTWQLRKPDTTAIMHGRDNGFATDGWIVAACCVVAIVVFGVAAMKQEQALLATIGCVACILALMTVSTLWMVLEMAAPADAEGVKAQWGIVATLGATVVASVGAIRAMRTARIY